MLIYASETSLAQLEFEANSLDFPHPPAISIFDQFLEINIMEIPWCEKPDAHTQVTRLSESVANSSYRASNSNYWTPAKTRTSSWYNYSIGCLAGGRLWT
jgi:hypothetical protein